MLCFLWEGSQAEEEELSAKVPLNWYLLTRSTFFILEMELVLEMTTRKKVVQQNQDHVQAGAPGDHGLDVPQPVGQEYKLESVLVKLNIQD